MRVDKWIWAVRMVKSRTLAGLFCQQGKVLVNGVRAKPSTQLKLDDIVTLNRKEGERVYRVTGFIPKRVSAPLAAENYEDLSPVIVTETPLEKASRPRFWGQRPKGEGRPTKKDWRDIQKAKNPDE